MERVARQIASHYITAMRHVQRGVALAAGSCVTAAATAVVCAAAGGRRPLLPMCHSGSMALTVRSVLTHPIDYQLCVGFVCPSGFSRVKCPAEGVESRSGGTEFWQNWCIAVWLADQHLLRGFNGSWKAGTVRVYVHVCLRMCVLSAKQCLADITGERLRCGHVTK